MFVMMIRAFINKIISLAEGSLKLNIAKKIQINRLILIMALLS